MSGDKHNGCCQALGRRTKCYRERRRPRPLEPCICRADLAPYAQHVPKLLRALGSTRICVLDAGERVPRKNARGASGQTEPKWATGRNVWLPCATHEDPSNWVQIRQSARGELTLQPASKLLRVATDALDALRKPVNVQAVCKLEMAVRRLAESNRLMHVLQMHVHSARFYERMKKRALVRDSHLDWYYRQYLLLDPAALVHTCLQCLGPDPRARVRDGCIVETNGQFESACACMYALRCLSLNMLLDAPVQRAAERACENLARLRYVMEGVTDNHVFAFAGLVRAYLNAPKQ